MHKKIKERSFISALVYSTDPSIKLDHPEGEETVTVEPGKQKLNIRLDSKQRAGKTVTLITGFAGRQADLEELAKKLKASCGSGGSAKYREIIIQGDHRDKVTVWLNKNGYTNNKKQ